MEELSFGRKTLVDGEPCGHPGCLSHVSHPCEKCGRIQGRDRTGLAQAKAMVGDAANRLEQMVNELRDGGGWVNRTYMGDDPDNPRTLHFSMELSFPDGRNVLVRERFTKKCPGYTTRMGDVTGRCIHCSAPAGLHPR